MIVWNYLTGWFIIDFVSVLPFWLVTLDMVDPMGVKSTGELAPLTGAERASMLTRIIKLMRMLKLARVFKASRVMQRVLLDVVMNKWELTYGFIKMMKLVVVLMVWAHWQACLWGLTSSFMAASGRTDNWVYAFHEKHEEMTGNAPNASDKYAAALYWSIMTLTSIGYGQMTPENTPERYLCSLYMMLSGIIWTYVIGSVAAIATTLDPSTVAYENTMGRTPSPALGITFMLII